MRKLVANTVVAVSVLALGSCGLVSNILDVKKKADRVAAALDAQLGTKPFIGFNIRNDVLSDVTVSFPLAGVRTLSVSELEAKVSAEVKKGFERAPQQLIISVVSTVETASKTK